jgi:hypothetical protein
LQVQPSLSGCLSCNGRLILSSFIAFPSVVPFRNWPGNLQTSGYCVASSVPFACSTIPPRSRQIIYSRPMRQQLRQTGRIYGLGQMVIKAPASVRRRSSARPQPQLFDADESWKPYGKLAVADTYQHFSSRCPDFCLDAPALARSRQPVLIAPHRHPGGSARQGYQQ